MVIMIYVELVRYILVAFQFMGCGITSVVTDGYGQVVQGLDFGETLMRCPGVSETKCDHCRLDFCSLYCSEFIYAGLQVTSAKSPELLIRDRLDPCF
jgi:hypothetical protein